MIEGDTDTEHIFALFVDKIRSFSNPDIEEITTALLAARAEIEELKDKAGVETPSTMNLVLSNGSSMVATRYVSSGEDSNSLYYSTMGHYSCSQEESRMDRGDGAVLIVSEPLNASDNWHRVENNQLVIVNRQRLVSTQQIRLNS